MSQFELKAEVRETTGKEKAKKLRAAGKFPAVVYGADAEVTSLTVPTHEAELLLARIHGEKVLVDLSYGNRNDKVFVRNVQRDPLTESILHVDFYRVDPNREIDTRVLIRQVGTPEGVRLGGLLEHGIREIDIHALPANVPPHVDVNVESLLVGQSIHVRDLPAMEGVRFLTSPDAVMFSVVGKKAEEPVGGKPADAAPAAAGAEKA
jgi:large subunit ribosomal protein L25